ncbi:enoyl-CoA hydratase [compost metagenome]
MDAEECHRIGLIHHMVPANEVFAKALQVANELANKPPVAMRLDKQRFREMSDPDFKNSIEAGRRLQKEAYDSGEPARMMEAFFQQRAKQA